MILNFSFEVEVVRLFHFEEIKLFIVSIVGVEVSLNLFGELGGYAKGIFGIGIWGKGEII